MNYLFGGNNISFVELLGQQTLNFRKARQTYVNGLIPTIFEKVKAQLVQFSSKNKEARCVISLENYYANAGGLDADERLVVVKGLADLFKYEEVHMEMMTTEKNPWCSISLEWPVPDEPKLKA